MLILKKILFCCFIFIFQMNCAFSQSIKIGEEIFLLNAKNKLEKSGWKPLITNKKMQDGTLERTWGEAKNFSSAGIYEVESCSGTGENYCFFNYKKNDMCIRLGTKGEFNPSLGQPKIFSWTIGRCN